MARVYSIAHLLVKCIFAVNDGIIILYPLFLANIFIYLYDNQYFQSFILLLKQILFVFVLFLVIIGNISYGFIRKKQIYVPHVLPVQYQNESIDDIEQKQQVTTVPHISEISTINPISDCCELLSDISVTISDDFPFEEKISTRPSRKLMCYCDGSYSYMNQIGYSGFRAWNGLSKYRSCPLRRPRSGSTESEVFAAYLAVQYTAKYHYNTLILHTDNSKVEQLLTRPKTKDYNDYPRFFNVLEQCYQKINDFDIRVERVRGHTTWYEQQQCSKKREFAIVDQLVRQKRQQHERRYYYKNYKIDPSSTFYFYRSGRRYIQSMQAEKFSATFITKSARRASSFF